MRTADFVSIHCPLNENTRNLVGRRKLALMKPEAFIINTARGGIINEDALFDVLEDGRSGPGVAMGGADGLAKLIDDPLALGIAAVADRPPDLADGLHDLGILAGEEFEGLDGEVAFGQDG